MKAYIVWAAYLGKSLKTKYVIQRWLEFLKAVRFGRYILNELVRWASYECHIVWCHSYSGVIAILGKSLKIKSVVQRRLEFLKPVRFGRYVLNELVWRASCEGLHSFGRISIYR